jgi:hypothetical protein
VPPIQCPECGRFLANAFVAGLADAPAPCPGCGARLTADAVGTASADAVATPDESGRSSPEPPDEVADPEVDGDPDAADADVLDGWDPDGGPTAWLDDRPPFPEDAAWVGGAAAAGALLGLIVGRRPLRGLLVGSVLGAGAAAAVRQIWRLRD